MSAMVTHPTITDRLAGGSNARLRNISLAIAGSLALWVSAKVQVPFYPVPITMQTFVVLAMGMAFGWRLAATTVALYLAQGAMGLPVFAGTPEKGLGLAYMMGPTGGYLLGMLPAAALCGWLAERGWDRSVVRTALAMIAGNVVIYAFGVTWLGAVIGWDKPVLQLGLYPFLYGDLAKLALAACALPLAWKLLGAQPSGSGL
ncbi:biotin transporter BioY [Mesorhizobium marinum]|uniref:biotin transporter BioY n=1 Tax=Mesorhizobium marinum TaxID=3228790 RepID=UPI0034668853